MKLFDDATIQVRSVHAARPKEKTVCPNCRVACNRDANFCGRCGLDLQGGTAALPVNQPTLSAEPQREGPIWSKPLPLMVMLSICILFLLGVLVAIGTSAFAFSHPTHPTHPTYPTHQASLARTQGHNATLKPGGRVWFYSDRSQDDSVALQLNSLPKLAHGNVYVLWLINPLRPNQLLSIGPLVPDSHNSVYFQSGRLSIIGANAQSLSVLFKRFAVTSEPAGHKWMRPSSVPVLQGTVS